MSKIFQFIQQNGPFFVLTMNGNCPAGRPFGAILEIGEDLYISTSDEKSVYKQIKANEHIQILSLKPGTRDWARVDGIAKECESLEIKKKMLEDCPALRKHYSSADEPHFNVFMIKVLKAEFY